MQVVIICVCVCVCVACDHPDQSLKEESFQPHPSLAANSWSNKASHSQPAFLEENSLVEGNLTIYGEKGNRSSGIP